MAWFTIGAFVGLIILSGIWQEAKRIARFTGIIARDLADLKQVVASQQAAKDWQDYVKNKLERGKDKRAA